ncbi:hypothetical protein Ari01nite_33940 [Paractinoplanes rishiriensis]|uniref:IclR-ED domain-containing protein n=1 Tax=Paractinoplanes rishiriensis TaxID=1050105 RepID=A0A919JZ70_9ACTN|nr:IclR family transcriptional regulator C-terminal domain-containing protein [Actinoplanes rishiriensis]GIE95929.1 hypothetical protein Ari01nite_33940 [Actinoplanes rishiriensis]
MRVGTRIPLTSLGAGEVLLAYADPDLIECVLVDYPRTNGHPIASTHPIRQRLAGIRRSGVAVTRRGLRSVVVAAPVFGPSGGVVAALSAAVRATDSQHVRSGWSGWLRTGSLRNSSVPSVAGRRATKPTRTDLPPSEVRGGAGRDTATTL